MAAKRFYKRSIDIMRQKQVGTVEMADDIDSYVEYLEFQKHMLVVALHEVLEAEIMPPRSMRSLEIKTVLGLAGYCQCSDKKDEHG